VKRRDFFAKAGAGAIAGLGVMGLPATMIAAERTGIRGVGTMAGSIRIASVDTKFEREPVSAPWGFKGGYMTEIWQVAARMQSEAGRHGIGLGTQNVLWSDSSVFASSSEGGGNALMYALTDRALQLAKGTTFTTPHDLLDQVLPLVHEHGRRITGNSALRKTFTLNALVAFDNAAWLLYAAENGIRSFDDLVPAKYRPGLSYRQQEVASVPAVGYSMPMSDVSKLADEGYWVMKIKLGQPGTQAEMLEKDMARLSAIHQAMGNHRTSHTPTGKIPYYLDANGRYEDKDTVERLLDHAKKIGALEQIVLFEEPFPEEYQAHVDDLPVRIVADESAHTDADVIERIQMGYGAIALKPIAKTLSMTMRMAQAAHERNTPCFCADLTVNPILVDWNKNVAARVAPVPGFTVGLMENNGHQNYRDWPRMESYHPLREASWRRDVDGVFRLGPDFWAESGGMFVPSPHYEELFRPVK
jgi:hypothetical protein